MADLFDIFPDLPRPRRKPVQQRIQEVRERAGLVREAIRERATEKRAAAALTKARWEQRVRARRP